MQASHRCILLLALASLPACFLQLDEKELRSGGEAGDVADGAAADRSSSDDSAALDGPDAEVPDARPFDTAAPVDAVAPIDAVAPVDGGPVDAAPVDAVVVDLVQPTDARDAQPSTLDLAAADLAVPPCTSLLCEDFESGTVANPWGSYASNATLAFDTTRAYRGTHAFHVTGDAVPTGMHADGVIGEGQTFGGSLPDLYARAFFYFPSPAPTMAVDIMTVFANVSPWDGSDLFVDGGQMAIGNRVTGSYNKSTTPLPLDRWTCVEWHVHQATSGGGGYDLWVDGQAIASLSLSGETTQPAASPFSGFQIEQGVYYSTTPIPAHELWADSLVLDTQRIGCSK